MERVDVATFAAALARGDTAFDNRSAPQFARDALPGTRHLTLEQVQAGELPAVDPDEPVYLICAWGTVSEVVAMYLEAAGFRRVRTVTGGLAAWRQAATTGAIKGATPDTDRR